MGLRLLHNPISRLSLACSFSRIPLLCRVLTAVVIGNTSNKRFFRTGTVAGKLLLLNYPPPRRRTAAEERSPSIYLCPKAFDPYEARALPRYIYIYTLLLFSVASHEGRLTD